MRFYIKLVYLIRAVKKCGNVHLGEVVQIDGKDFILNNGVKRRGPDTLWDCIGIDYPDIHIEAVQERMVRKNQAWITAVKFHYNFYITNWLGIDSRKGNTKISRGI